MRSRLPSNTVVDMINDCRGREGDGWTARGIMTKTAYRQQLLLPCVRQEGEAVMRTLGGSTHFVLRRPDLGLTLIMMAARFKENHFYAIFKEL